VIVGGGVSTIHQFLRAQLIDELHVVVVPILLGDGESLFAGINLPSLGYEVKEHQFSEMVTHLIIRKQNLGETRIVE
jgi:dihydrofolate reductase